MKGYETDKQWIDLRFKFFGVFENNYENENLIEWLTQIDNLFRVNKNKPFELPEIDSI